MEACNPRTESRSAIGRTAFRWLTVVAAAFGLALATAVTAPAEPAADAEVDPFPDMKTVAAWYDEMDPAEFFLPDRPGVWFLTPTGLNCGIWDKGGFGCTGPIPGLPPGNNHIAWFNGNRSVHHGWTAAIQFPPGQAQRVLPPRSYVTHNSTSCATTPAGYTFCRHGDFEFMTSLEGTWFKAWDDQRSHVCNAYNSCPRP